MRSNLNLSSKVDISPGEGYEKQLDRHQKRGVKKWPSKKGGENAASSNFTGMEDKGNVSGTKSEEYVCLRENRFMGNAKKTETKGGGSKRALVMRTGRGQQSNMESSRKGWLHHKQAMCKQRDCLEGKGPL